MRGCKPEKDPRGALAQVDELPVDRDGACEEISDIVGDVGRLFSLAFRNREGVTDG